METSLFSYKLKVFAGDKVVLAQMMQFLFERLEKIVGKGENAGYQHFLLSRQCFLKGFSLGVSKFVSVPVW